MNEIRKIPEGYHSITPALIVKNGDEAIEFYKNGFGAEERCPERSARWLQEPHAGAGADPGRDSLCGGPQ